jgi:nitroreductase
MQPRFVPYPCERRPIEEVAARAAAFNAFLAGRRTVRDFSPDPVPRAVIEELVRAASTAASGAHKQPWTFVAVADPSIKRRIRAAAEREERVSYELTMPHNRPRWTRRTYADEKNSRYATVMSVRRRMPFQGGSPARC